MDSIISYLVEGKLPTDKVEAQKIRNFATKYCLIDG